MSRLDPRLEGLSDAQYAAVVEFLANHRAWNTDFTVTNSYCLALEWRDEEAHARLEWHEETFYADGYDGVAWNLFWRMKDDSVRGRLEVRGDLRECGDFAGFVQRFGR